MFDTPPADSKTQRHEAAKKKDFHQWMEKPETKLMLSLIPAGEHPEALRSLVESAFTAGSSSGVGMMLCEMLEAMLKPKGADAQR